MSRLLSLRVFLFGATAFCALATAAVPTGPAGAGSDDEAEVVAVRFGRPRGPDGTWWMMEVEVMLRSGSRNSSRYIDRPGVAVELGCEVVSAPGRRVEFYQAQATAVTVAQGRALFRFYLPPEIVSRDRLASDARYFFIELSLQGRTVPLRREHVSADLAHAETLERFRARVAAEAPANRGVLVAQPFTPFAAFMGGPAGPTLLTPRP